MPDLQFKKVADGLWEIIGRGKIELTRQGVFYIGMEKPGKWSDEELKQITTFIDDVLKPQQSLRKRDLVMWDKKQK
jgi:hypothetical protein